MEIEMEQPNKVDENLYSRQIGTFGMETMSKLVKMRVLIMGMRGLGVETAKNLVLAGPKSVTIWDPVQATELDKGTNFYIKNEHVSTETKCSRAQACLKQLSGLNPYVALNVLDMPDINMIADLNVLNNYDLVCVTDVYAFATMKSINDICRAHDKGFIMTACKGMLGYSFVDFGNNHVVFDKNGEACKSILISNITADGIVTTQEDKRHDLEDGDLVLIKEIVGLESLNGKTLKVEKVLTPYTLQLEDLSGMLAEGETYVRNGILEEVKAKIKTEFKNLENSLNYFNNREFDMEPDMDFMKPFRLIQLKFMLSKTLKNQETYVPEGTCVKQRNVVGNTEKLRKQLEPNTIEIEKAENAMEIEEEKPEDTVEEWTKNLDTDLVKYCLAFWNLEIAPMTAFWGGIIAQEIVKFTGKFNPINQWMIHEFYSNVFKHLDQDKVLQNLELEAIGRHRDQILMFGYDIQKQIENTKLFMIGAGALGCEYIKLFALMGMATGDNGMVTITDDDTIEISNLNRQFLFRKRHVGSSKAETVITEALEMNPAMKSKAMTLRVENKSESTFTDNFYEGLTYIVNAVDNVKARNYVDGKAVLHKKWLFEAGTLGTKCNSQIIVPDKTESYTDSVDPEEKHIPMCTLRNFPFLIEHCIEWSRERFFSVFSSASTELKKIQDSREGYFKDLLKESKTDGATVTEKLQGVKSLLELATNPSLENMVCFAREEFQKHFTDGVAKLLRLFPKDFRDKDGNVFWSSPKRAPTVLNFDCKEEKHVNFIKSTVLILSQIFTGTELKKGYEKDLDNFLKNFKEQEIKIEDEKEERKKALNKNAPAASNDLDLDEKIKELFEISKQVDTKLSIEVLEFEKDDDSNGHIDYMTLSSNFRAENYEIEQAQRHKIKMIAGKIIPAIATTTAMIVGAVGIEFYKFYLESPLENLRSCFSNLGISMINFSEPMPPVVAKDKDYDEILLGPVKAMPSKWNTWSRIQVKGKKMKVKELVEYLNKEFSITMEGLSIGRLLVWNSFGQKPDYSESVIEDLYNEHVGEVYPGKRYFVFTASAVDAEMVDLNMPYVVYYLED